MSRNLLIFGNNNLAILLRKYIERYTDYNVRGFCVDRAFLVADTFSGYPNIAFEDVSDRFSKRDTDILICIGNRNMNDLRKTKYEEVKALGYKVAGFIHPSVCLETDQLGEGNILLENVSVGMNTRIGNCNILWNGCNISHDTVVGDFNYIAPSAAVAGRVKVGNNCFLGVGSSVRGGIIVADYTLLGGGCFLNNSTEPYDVYVPARAVKLNYKSTDMPIS